MTEASEYIAKVLTSAARAVADCLSFFGLESKNYVFAVLLWPAGEPGKVSSIAGSADLSRQSELSAACLAASEKAKNQPTHVSRHDPTPAGHA